MARIEMAENGDVEIHLDGKYVASFRAVDIKEADKGVLCNMLEAARNFGNDEAKREIRKALGIR